MQRFCILACVWITGFFGQASAQIPTPQAPADRPPDPTATTFAECANEGGYNGAMPGGKVCIWRCANQGTTLTCNLAYQLTYNTTWVNAKPLLGWTPSLLDNFQVSHKLTRLSWLNGRGQRQATITMSQGDWAWIVAEFSDGASDITKAKIVVTGPRMAPFTLSADVTNIN
jgi:hypothetical protein